MEVIRIKQKCKFLRTVTGTPEELFLVSITTTTITTTTTTTTTTNYYSPYFLQ